MKQNNNNNNKVNNNYLAKDKEWAHFLSTS